MMTSANDARRAHEILDRLDLLMVLSKEQEKLLRSFLPELPTQMSLEALRHDVHDVWAGVNGNEWPDDMYCDLETWLHELHEQLKGLKDTPAAVPALPAGMRIANHADLGRVVVSPTTDEYDDHRIFHLNSRDETGAKSRWASVESLTFIDAEPAHPEFLQAGAEYQEAPWGTIVAKENSGTAWIKKGNSWSSTDGEKRTDSHILWGVPRKVLRWGEGA